MTDLIKFESKPLVQFDPEQIKILKASKFKTFTDPEVAYSLEVSKGLGLNPLVNQIHFVKRGGNVVAQVGIDGFRLIAQRTGLYAGQDLPDYVYSPTDVELKKPLIARVTVYKIVGGVRCPFSGEARFEEYDQNNEMWKRMRHNQLAKCAEAQALRKAFPAELSAVYEPAEISEEEKVDRAKSIQAEIMKKKDSAPVPAMEPPVSKGVEVSFQPENSDSQVNPSSTPSGSEPRSQAKCNVCRGSDLMKDRYKPGMLYCRACKGTQPE